MVTAIFNGKSKAPTYFINNILKRKITIRKFFFEAFMNLSQ